MQPVERITCSLYNTSVDVMLINHMTAYTIYDIWQIMTSSGIPTQRLQVACFRVIFPASGSLEMSQTMQSVKAVMVRNCSFQLAKQTTKQENVSSWPRDYKIKTSLRFRSLFEIVYALLIYHVLTKLCRKILVPLVLIIHFIADERSFIKDQAVRSGFGLPSFPGVWNPPNMPTSRSLDFSYSILLHYISTLLLKCII